LGILGLRTSKAEAKESGRIHVVEEKEMAKMDPYLTNGMTKSSTLVTKVTENVSQIEEHQLVQQSHQPEKRQKDDAEEVLDNTTRKNVSENSAGNTKCNNRYWSREYVHTSDVIAKRQ